VKDYRYFIILVAIVMTTILVASISEQRSEDQQMKACVAAGMEWIRDFGNYYECKEK
jgi:hypothetical protein